MTVTLDRNDDSVVSTIFVWLSGVEAQSTDLSTPLKVTIVTTSNA